LWRFRAAEWRTHVSLVIASFEVEFEEEEEVGLLILATFSFMYNHFLFRDLFLHFLLSRQLINMPLTSSLPKHNRQLPLSTDLGTNTHNPAVGEGFI
jgi:hypothetical protein